MPSEFTVTSPFSSFDKYALLSSTPESAITISTDDVNVYALSPNKTTFKPTLAFPQPDTVIVAELFELFRVSKPLLAAKVVAKLTAGELASTNLYSLAFFLSIS